MPDLLAVEVAGTEFPIPEGVEWTPGGLYRWRVETADGQYQAAGRFRLLSDRQREQFQQARDALGSSGLMRAAIYRSFGFYGAALTELRALRDAEPGNRALHWAARNLEADIHRHRAGAE
jgi:hypothetical protein